MKRSRSGIALVAFLAVLAFGALASASASAALPEFGTLKGADKFSAEFNSPVWRQTSLTVECTSGTISGEITAAKTIKNTTIKFVGCKSGELRCPTGVKESGTREPEGQVTTNPLEGTLVYLNKTAKTVGVIFKAQTGTRITKFICLADPAEVVGSLAMQIVEPLNTKTTEFKLSSSGSATAYENEAGEKKTSVMEDDWPTTSFGPVYWETASLIKLSYALEVKA
jgi:hypothetical protein